LLEIVEKRVGTAWYDVIKIVIKRAVSLVLVEGA
jgi:hypothetical protein